MTEQRDLGENFSEFLRTMRFLDGEPSLRDMWDGLREAGLWVNQQTINSWLIGKTYPSTRFKPEITSIFGITDEEFNSLQAKPNQVLQLLDMPRHQLIGALVADVVLGSPLSTEEARSLEGILLPPATDICLE